MNVFGEVTLETRAVLKFGLGRGQGEDDPMNIWVTVISGR